MSSAGDTEDCETLATVVKPLEALLAVQLNEIVSSLDEDFFASVKCQTRSVQYERIVLTAFPIFLAGT